MFSLRESGARLKSSVTGSRWRNGAALPRFLVSRRCANWGLSGVFGKNTWGFCEAVSPMMRRTQSLVWIRREQGSAFNSNHQTLLGLPLRLKKSLCTKCFSANSVKLWFWTVLNLFLSADVVVRCRRSCENINICWRLQRPSLHHFSDETRAAIARIS